MTKDVLIRIVGLQSLGSSGSQEPIELVIGGEYYFRNGSHYLKYEETVEGFDQTTINYIKINPKGVEVRKKGLIIVNMVFVKEKKDDTYYTTPFGNIEMGISAARVNFQEGIDHLGLRVDYVLEMNGEYVADCFLTVEAQSKGAGNFVF